MNSRIQDSCPSKSSTLQLIVLSVLRIGIGWHFLYEGIAKLLNPQWSAAGYLEVSRWIFADLFRWMASTPAVLTFVNFLVVWGMILIGLGLMLGLLTRTACAAGILLLGFFYICNPPLVGLGLGSPLL